MSSPIQIPKVSRRAPGLNSDQKAAAQKRVVQTDKGDVFHVAKGMESTRTSPLRALHARLEKGFRWIFGLKEKKSAQGGKSPEVQILANDGSRRQESARETEFKKRNLASSNSTSSRSLVTESEEGSVEERKESTQASESDPQPVKKESLINTPQAVQRRTVAIGEGSQYSEKVGQLLHLAVDSVDPEKLESNRSYRTVTALVGGTIDDVDPPSTVKLVTSGHLDKFIRELGALVSPQTAFETKVEWDFSVQEETRQVTATYRLQPKEGGRGGPSLEGGIEFSIDDGDWQLLDPCLIGPAVPPALTKAKVDPNTESDVHVASSSSSDDLETIEFARVVEYVEHADDAEDAGDASTSSDKGSNLALPALQTGTADDSASEPVLLKKPKSLKKNPLAAAIRGKAWDLKETVGQSVKETASDIRAGAWDGKENAKDSVKQAAKTIAENLKSEVQREAESLYGKNPSAMQLKTASDRVSDRTKKYNGVLRACIPEMGDFSVLIGSGPMPFLEYVSGPLVLKAVLNQFEKGLFERHGTRILVEPYVQGALDCYKEFGDRQFAQNKVNWLPKNMQEAYKAAGSPQNVTKWLENLIEIRKLLNSIKRDREKGIQLQFQIDEYNKLCKQAGVDSDLIEDEKIVFRNALSYATGWKTAFDEADKKKLMV